MKFTIASKNGDGKISVLVNNAVAKEKISLPNTGGLKKWQTVEVKGVALKQGRQALRVRADTGGFNLKSVQFIKEK